MRSYPVGITLVAAAAAVATTPPVIVPRAVTPESHLHLSMTPPNSISASGYITLTGQAEPDINLEFGILTEADIEMMQMAANAPADTLDYSALFVDDE